jgi:subtilisin family serine protease
MKKFAFLMFKHIFRNLALLVLSVNSLTAQKPALTQERKAGQLLIQVSADAKETNLTQIINDLYLSTNILSRIGRVVAAPPLSIYRLDFDETDAQQAQQLLNQALKHEKIKNAQLNYISEIRATPNDPIYAEQWHHYNSGSNNGLAGADINSEAAWNITKGGNTVDGDTVVVAIVDAGFCPDHLDIQPNVWYNYAEIPNNGIDDDQNGYIDDFRGWNTTTLNDVISTHTHGCAVEGTLGAVGNNNRGVSGVAWRVKMMHVISAGSDDEIIGAYAYIFQQRRLWNLSQGRRGAFVVVSSSSFGRDARFPSSAPLWCAMYDSLGRVGVLNIASTANRGVDVEVVGDLPSLCTSPYLVAVTASTNNDTRRLSAAYGRISVDLAAPGEGIVTTGLAGDYVAADGTSFAAPMVAGVVALAYTAPCTDWLVMAKRNPAEAALSMRTFLLRGVDTLDAFRGLVSANGRLNAAKTLQFLLNTCPYAQQPAAPRAVNITNTSAAITWRDDRPLFASGYRVRYRKQGETNWITLNTTTPPIALTNLQICKEYEVSLITLRGDSVSAERLLNFKTDGCCQPPQNIWITNLETNRLNIKFSKVTAATSYKICATLEGATTCAFQQTIMDTFLVVNNLEPCKNYKLKISTICNGGQQDTILSIQTRGCGACYDATYCRSVSTTVANEWLDTVAIGSVRIGTGKNNGYGDFTVRPPIELRRGTSYMMTMIPAFSAGAYQEAYCVWLDLNQNGTFENNEQMLQIPRSNSLRVVGNIFIPTVNVPTGITRMRVTMKYVGFSGIAPTPCEIFSGGEVEDYCMLILPTSSTATDTPPQYADAISIYPNPFDNQIFIHNELNENSIFSVEIYSIDGKKIMQKTWSDNAQKEKLIALDHLPPLSNGVYFIKLQTAKGAVAKKIVKQ